VSWQSADPDTERGGLGVGDKEKGEVKAELHIKFVVYYICSETRKEILVSCSVELWLYLRCC
jgi:hypothetical protein